MPPERVWTPPNWETVSPVRTAVPQGYLNSHRAPMPMHTLAQVPQLSDVHLTSPLEYSFTICWFELSNCQAWVRHRKRCASALKPHPSKGSLAKMEALSNRARDAWGQALLLTGTWNCRSPWWMRQGRQLNSRAFNGAQWLWAGHRSWVD